MFEWLPLIAVIDDKILWVHGGIGSTFVSLDDVNKFTRPIWIEHEVNSF